jgi:hypothetical protein
MYSQCNSPSIFVLLLALDRIKFPFVLHLKNCKSCEKVLGIKHVFHFSLPYSASIRTIFPQYFQDSRKIHEETHIGINVKSSVLSYLNQNCNVLINLNKHSHVKYHKILFRRSQVVM